MSRLAYLAELVGMGDKPYAPLSVACVRALSDKLYEKRKAAALEIEKMVKEFVAAENHSEISQLIKVLGEFALSQNPHTRKGGLIGLAAVAIGTGSGITPFIKDLLHPVFACFSDSNPNVRYYATESLYNVVRVSRGSILVQFNEIFTTLTKLAMDGDQNVKNGSEMLDRLMKDIVSESPEFNLITFIPVLRERLYCTTPCVQMVVVSWVSVLQTVPDVELVPFLPDVLDGLFFILESPKMEVKKTCEIVIGEFLATIRKNPSTVKYQELINILITHAQSEDNLVQMIALIWIKEFITLSHRMMLPYSSGILMAVIPCLALEDPSMNKSRNIAEDVSTGLMCLITIADDREQPEGSSSTVESSFTSDQMPEEIDLKCILEVLVKQLRNTPVACKTAALRWIYHLQKKTPNKMRQYIEDLFKILLKTTTDPSDEVVLLALQVLAQIASSSQGTPPIDEPISESDEIQYEVLERGDYFNKFLQDLLRLFATEASLLEDRGPFIIRQLCVMLSAEDIYKTLAELLGQETNLTFATVMVQTMASILLTSKELYRLRLQLRSYPTPESCELFVQLYKSWCHSPVATLTICLLTQNYAHAATLVRVFPDLDITTDFLVEIDKLIQLLESPIFTYLRMQLLDHSTNGPLVETLYGLLMLLPQTEAFNLLRCRLNCIPPPELMKRMQPTPKYMDEKGSVDFDELLLHFKNTQKKHADYKIRKIQERLQSTIEVTTDARS